MPKIKVIGGSYDGKEVDYDLPMLYVRVPQASPVGWSDGDKGYQPIASSTEVYQKSKIVGETEVFTVFVPQHWTGDDLIRELIRRA